MPTDRPFVLSIAGFDPSGGAGVLADVKTFEQHRVYGLGIVTGNTIQTEDAFHAMQWIAIDFVCESIEKLFGQYDIKAVKIGIVASLEYLKKIVAEIRRHSSAVPIVWDPVLKSTTAFEFTTIENQSVLSGILKEINLITPNYDEILQLNPKKQPKENAVQFSEYCAVLLKGGHHPSEKGTDYLFIGNRIEKLEPKVACVFQKHGSGCVLSAAITANIALNNDLYSSCTKAKNYIENYLNSTNQQLGYHHV